MEEIKQNDVIRIYICGPHSTGKTTLLNDLKPHLGSIKIVDEVARGIIKKHGWTRDDFIPNKHPDVFQQLNLEILAAQIEVERSYSALGQGESFTHLINQVYSLSNFSYYVLPSLFVIAEKISENTV